MNEESYQAEDQDEIVWLRLNRLKSVILCEKLIRSKLKKEPNSEVTDEIVKQKAKGLSSTIKSALGYWNSNSLDLNAKVLSRYYFLLQMTIADQVSSVNNTDDLKEIQKHTEFGHGLGIITDLDIGFPNGYYIYLLKSGHFHSYCKARELNFKDIEVTKRYRKMSEVPVHDIDKLIPISDIFRRIPELQNVIQEYLDEPPLSFHVGYAFLENDAKTETKYDSVNGFVKKDLVVGDYYSFLDIFVDPNNISIDLFKTCNLPFAEIFAKHDSAFKQDYYCGKVFHPKEKHWWQHINMYKSAYSPMSIISPLLGKIDDYIALNFMLLYSLSIIVRYYPDLWSKIDSDELNHINSLIEYYISIIDHTIPLVMLSKITGKDVQIHNSSGLF